MHLLWIKSSFEQIKTDVYDQAKKRLTGGVLKRIAVTALCVASLAQVLFLVEQVQLQLEQIV